MTVKSYMHYLSNSYKSSLRQVSLLQITGKKWAQKDRVTCLRPTWGEMDRVWVGTLIFLTPKPMLFVLGCAVSYKIKSARIVSGVLDILFFNTVHYLARWLLSKVRMEQKIVFLRCTEGLSIFFQLTDLHPPEVWSAGMCLYRMKFL